MQVKRDCATLSLLSGLARKTGLPLFEKNYTMLSSVLGTWIPFALIFGATYLAGQWAAGGRLPPGRGGQSNDES